MVSLGADVMLGENMARDNVVNERIVYFCGYFTVIYLYGEVLIPTTLEVKKFFLDFQYETTTTR